jgi:hypothetical protein
MDVALENGAFYARRYILSACMNWNDCIYVRTEGSKPIAWKKGKVGEVRINPTSWKLELKNVKDSWEKSQILSVSAEEIKDASEKTSYILVGLEKNQFLSISGKREFVSLFYCGLLFLLEKPEAMDHPLMQAKTEVFQQMATDAQKFLAHMNSDTVAPPIPELPENLRSVSTPGKTA